ncbi:PilZ domain-containing protein [Bosea sp. PAMC 26642]|uniref:PilZ domain-containing protein n=1 Tax=Bosea sp. (strain PAMC 26642) TaxID=1792307 RepID=UPI000B2B58FE|nr:PilZ domain-containing protein [Bosea sp. PAMC 26642]
MLTTREEVPCSVIDMSPGGLSLHANVEVKRGERIVAYIDEIGRVEGFVARRTKGGFAMSITATPRKREDLAATLTFQANRADLEIGEQREEPRKPARHDKTEIVLADGTCYVARILNGSSSGGAAISAAPVSVGMKVWIGGRASLVLRSNNSEHAFRYL